MKLVLAGAVVLLVASVPFAQGGAFPSGPVRVAPSPSALPRVLVVDAGGGGDFAARSGDVLLLRSDLVVNDGVLVAGKSLTILGDGAVRTILHNGIACETTLSIRDLDADQRVYLRRLRLQNIQASDPCVGYVLSVVDVAGTVWVEDTTVEVPFPQLLPGQVAYGGIFAQDVQSLVLMRVTVRPSPTGAPVGAGVPGIPAAVSAEHTSVHVYNTLVHGADQGIAFLLSGGNGGDGVLLVDATMNAVTSTFLGGDGGGCSAFAGGVGGDGGVGIVSRINASAELVDVNVAGGQGGLCDPVLNSGAPGAATQVDATSSVAMTSGVSRTYVIDAPVLAGGTATLSASGQPGELVASLIGVDVASTYLPPLAGIQLVAPPFQVVVEGTVPAGGVLVVPLPVPALRPGVEVALLYRQGLFLDVGGQARLAGATTLVTLSD